ncbi:phosphoglucosamine mutase [Tropheryma whipplei]|uniref:Phosphoglucosamine mutase n=2 Tax=Tropheryma whipplei TaxID=2039 RepID=GLMM_TROWT|nr:phosphoglucosamine mutase [Tropheryma whipplei]Q83GU5.1 RecName: Full=Phosphoglucosamine mutase [Tropheryma whipplei str. Twist]Q83NS5.1 RecName: Full=Phosphoglucosamine mutase [Tropheryma whipplei TW08/27]AAO44243.1 phosphohexose mutase [Tropheryma whipplei str. Twist]MCO8183060.1 phosphoglucosamine mutase [Tropheryma whipplei]MCO8190665.1 phosphoglucosamine mutase [Tropheryma whipplei]CAD66835.1 putative phospho-sugar mutase [Tropheryma whipplei TW08/27]
MARLFGTDGIRALANGDLLTPELAMAVARAAAVVFTHGRVAKRRQVLGKRPVAIVARDPRISGDFLVAAISAGLASSGVDVLDAGVIPTPAVAFLVKNANADFGFMISASHNPGYDNGVKIFAHGGVKLPDVVEDRIEYFLDKQKLSPIGSKVGRITRFVDAEDRYQMHLLSTLFTRIDGVKVVIDCANGAASGVSPDVFKSAGAAVKVICADPNGVNINDGVGSAYPERLRAEVIRNSATLGLAFDGDADRCIAVDSNGNTVDGDQIMAILARSMQQRGTLRNKTLVTTIMSNIGLDRAMKKLGINLKRTQVGDRYVIEAMTQGGFNIGGEQSGHIILSDYSTAGDGILAGLHLCAEIIRTGKSLTDLASIMEIVPQVTANIETDDPTTLLNNKKIRHEISRIEKSLKGRVVIRPSGTEPLIRIMVEDLNPEKAERACSHLADFFKQEIQKS